MDGLKLCHCGKAENDHRHIKVVHLKPEMVLESIFGVYSDKGWRVEVPGLPRDARFVGMGHSVASNSISVFFEHPSYPPVHAGHLPEMLEVHVRPPVGEKLSSIIQ